MGPRGFRTVPLLPAAAVLVAAAPFAFADGPRADLVIERWSTPSAVYAGDVLDVVVRMTNRGQAAAGRFANELRLESLARGTAPVVKVRWSTEGLAAGQSGERGVSLAIPGPTVPGEYAVRVEVDVGDTVAEENEHNNLAERRVVVTPRPPSVSSPKDG
jgi:subtilase family serine protease